MSNIAIRSPSWPLQGLAILLLCPKQSYVVSPIFHCYSGHCVARRDYGSLLMYAYTSGYLPDALLSILNPYPGSGLELQSRSSCFPLGLYEDFYDPRKPLPFVPPHP
jgi:hypothetical protein